MKMSNITQERRVIAEENRDKLLKKAAAEEKKAGMIGNHALTMQLAEANRALRTAKKKINELNTENEVLKGKVDELEMQIDNIVTPAEKEKPAAKKKPDKPKE
jgi:hypothetical protein